jgi:hypothetical protein
MAVDLTPEKRWPWWGQFRDFTALLAGCAIVAQAIYRADWNPIAMLFAAVCFGIVSSGVLSRYLIGRWEESDKK